MSIFTKKQTSSDISTQIDKLYKELSMQIEVNQELKNENESLKNAVLSQKKEMARFEQNLRTNPLSQLEILHKELSFMNEKVHEIMSGQNEAVQEQMNGHVKAICTDAFELLNQIKELQK
jgi:hypothetical protein